jgi:hypothetical protein
MGLSTPEKIRTLQRKLYVKAKGDDTRSPGGGPGIQPPGSLRGAWPRAVAGPPADVAPACLDVKPVREPDAGKPHVRFDERVRETESWTG